VVLPSVLGWDSDEKLVGSAVISFVAYLQSTTFAVDHALKELEYLPPPGETSVAGYLVSGKVSTLLLIE
jgi:hypothetical protein